MSVSLVVFMLSFGNSRFVLWHLFGDRSGLPVPDLLKEMVVTVSGHLFSVYTLCVITRIDLSRYTAD